MLPLMTVRIFHVDDHEVIRIGIDAVIEKCPGLQLVGWAASAEEALHRIPVARPDVAILDIQLGTGRTASSCAGRSARAGPRSSA